MADLNKVMVIGRLGQDPEMRYTSNGVACTRLSVATSRPGKKADRGAAETDWHSVIVWDKQAEACNQYLAKGSQVYIEGRLQNRKWEGQDGRKNSKTEIVAASVIFLDNKNASGHPGYQEECQDDTDDLPF